MRSWKKAVFVGLAFAGCAGAYGTARFHLQRYSPQCEHLPGVCVFGRQDPESASVSIHRMQGGSVIRTLELCYSGCSSLSATYKDDSARVPDSISLGREERYSCTEGAPVQVVVSPRRTMVPRGCYGGSVLPGSLGQFGRKLSDFYRADEPERYMAPYMGLREIFSGPRPLELRCADQAEPMQAALCDSGRAMIEAEELACGMQRRLAEIAGRESGFALCRVQQARRGLAQALDDASPQVLSERRLREEVSKAELTLRDIQDNGPQSPQGGFSRGWDLLFGAGFIAAIALAVRKALKKAKPSG